MPSYNGTIRDFPLAFTGFLIAVDGPATGPLTAGANAAFFPDRNVRVVNTVFQALNNYTSMNVTDATTGYAANPIPYIKAGHFYIQRKRGDVDPIWFEISNLVVNRSISDNVNGVNVADFLIGYENTRRNFNLWGCGTNQKIRAPWLFDEDIQGGTTPRGTTTPGIVSLCSSRTDYITTLMNRLQAHINNSAEYPLNRQGIVQGFINNSMLALNEFKRHDYKNLGVHHSGPQGEQDARLHRLVDSTNYVDIQLRPFPNTSSGVENRRITYWPQYECTSPNVPASPNGTRIAMNE